MNRGTDKSSSSSANPSSSSADSDALELALAFVDEFDLVGDDERASMSDATAVASAALASIASSAPARGARAKSRASASHDSQTRKPEPTTTAMPSAVPVAKTPGSGAETTTKALNRKDELTYLRAKVRELHVRLELLQKSSSSNSGGNADEDEEKSAAQHVEEQTSQQRLPSPEFLAQHRVMWENVALRQSQEREKVERENAQLKALLESQLKVAKGLERVLKKRGNVDIFRPSTAFKKVKLCRGDSPADESALREEAASELEKIYQTVDDLAARTGIDAMDSESQDTQMKSDPVIGMHVQFVDNRLLDFDVQTVSDAVWAFISEEGMKSMCYYHEDFEVSSDSVGRFFGMKIKEKQAKCDLRGVNTSRMYVEANRTVIVWISVVEPVAFSGEPIAGIRFRESGVLILKAGLPASPTASGAARQTRMQMCSRLVPDMDTSNADESVEQPASLGGGLGSSCSGVVGAVTDFLINSIEGNISFTNMMIDKLLPHRSGC